MPNRGHALARVDHVLNELDRLARTATSPSKFYAELLAQLKFLVDAVDCSLVVPVQAGRWCALSATCPAFAEEAERQMTNSVSTKLAGQVAPWLELAIPSGKSSPQCDSVPQSDLPLDESRIPDESKTAEAFWLGRCLNGIGWSSGGIILKQSSPILSETKELLSALADIACSFWLRHELAQAESRSHEIRSVLGSIRSGQGSRQLDRLLVDGARCLIDADRVSLIQASSAGAKAKILAVSGQPHLDPQANFNVGLTKLLTSSSHELASPQLERYAKENGSAVAIVWPFGKPVRQSQSLAPEETSNALLLEWFDRDRYLQNASQVSSTLAWVTHAWSESPRVTTAPFWKSRPIRWAIAVGLLIGLVWFFLSPTELAILAEGTLQPSEQRFVFAPADGYVDQIQIADGQRVQAGEIIVSLTSPQLQLQINQVAAEIGIVDQKRDGLNIAINQLKSADDPANLTGSRLVGEVQELEAKRKNLVEQKNLLDREQERLQLRSPIDGNVIAWEVGKYLENRPVRRGDMLLRVAALEKNWQIDASIVDWEAGYVTDASQKNSDSATAFAVEFVVASSSSETHLGQVVQISDTMRNVIGSQRLDLVISPDQPIQRPRLGTSATVSIPCGHFPRWFVWTRSIVDAVRRRFWL